MSDTAITIPRDARCYSLWSRPELHRVRVRGQNRNASLTVDSRIALHITLKNTGNRAGAEVIQVYRHTRNSATHQPDQQLCGFAKVLLQSSQAATVTITLAANFRTFDHGTSNWVLEAGTIQLRIGSSSRDIRLTQAINVVSTQSSAMSPKPRIHQNFLHRDARTRSVFRMPYLAKC